ncbi:dihydrofolate reductase family protein [Actinoplanes sp. CA-054009]
MRKVVLYSLLSLDGVAEHPDQFLFDFDQVMDDNLAAVIGSQDAVLLGRRTYDDWAPYWPVSDIQPFADFINSVPKYVFTAKEPELEWAATTVVQQTAVDFVRDLKAREGGDIGLHGSIDLSRSLLAAGLVDELRLVTAPTVAGAGRQLFEPGGGPSRWALRDVRPTPSGGVLTHYAAKAY